MRNCSRDLPQRNFQQDQRDAEHRSNEQWEPCTRARQELCSSKVDLTRKNNLKLKDEGKLDGKRVTVPAGARYFPYSDERQNRGTKISCGRIE